MQNKIIPLSAFAVESCKNVPINFDVHLRLTIRMKQPEHPRTYFHDI
jgi:hypothetical protein